jgi:diguanylate cyclase (GGDEF)-like protein/PAS domain S-box-containing protein
MSQPKVSGQHVTLLERMIVKATRMITETGPVFWVSFYGIVLIIGIVLGTSLMINSIREREITRGSRELENTVRLFAKQFDKHLESFDSVPKSIATSLAARARTAEDFAAVASQAELHQLLKIKVNDSADFAGVNIFGSDGNFLNSSERFPVPPVNLADREFFRLFASGAHSPTVAIQLVDSRLSKGVTIVLARKVSGPDGTFLGVITRSIAPEVFENFFSTLSLQGGALSLLHQDGSLLARHPHAGSSLGKNFGRPPFIEQALAEGSVTKRIVSPVDGQERIASARLLEHYPLLIVVSRAKTAMLTAWRDETRTFIIGAALTALILGGVLIAIVKYLREQHRRLDIAVNNMTQGLLLYDSAERLILCNRRFLDIFGLSSEIVRPGCSLRDIIQHRKDTGSIAGDVDLYCERIRRESRSGQLTSVELPDGRWMQVANRPVAGGGWVCTIEDITEQRESEMRALRLASFDTLTELPNRSTFNAHLAEQLSRCSAQYQVALVFLDIDEFKSVNDTLGHKVGDELLKSIARNLTAVKRRNELVARLGGDEFAVIVSGLKDDAELLSIVERLQGAICRQHDCGEHQLAADTSIGIAFAPRHGTSSEEILQNADLAMYSAKSAGKRTYRVFDPELEKKARDRRELEVSLRNALLNGEIDVHYQPIIHLHTDEIVCCEALARWHHHERGYISPAEFIPIAEQTGLMDELGEYVLRKACEEAATWPTAVKLAVNVSASQFKSGALALKVASALAYSGLSPRQLELEITEAVLMQDDDGALKVLRELKALGIRVALDDFGTGYSSLSYLRRFPFDKIKIDRSFVSDLTEADSSSSIIRAVVALATEHRITTTAEGVETEEQKEALRMLNCAEMQGYLFSPAREASDIRRIIDEEAGLRAGKRLPIAG